MSFTQSGNGKRIILGSLFMIETGLNRMDVFIRLIPIFTWFFIYLHPHDTTAQSIKTEKRIVNDTVHVDFINPHYAPIEFRFEVKNAYQNDFKVENSVVIPAQSTVSDVISYPSFYTNDSTKNVNHYINMKGNYGSPATVMADKDHRYLLPYPKGKSYHIMQGNFGDFSHNLPHSRHAIDFELSVGDTITAARGGKVILVKEDSKEHGPTRKFIDKGNKIIIMHSDGTFGHYVHLDFKGAFVEEGDKIEAGQPIGLSGFTGFTTKPHLHFVVMRERGLSIPIKYKGVRGHDVPEEGTRYRRK